MIAVAAIGYSVVCVLFALLAALLATSWRGHRFGLYIISACIANAVWGGVLAWDLVVPNVNSLLVFSVELIRSTFWIVFLAYLTNKIGISRLVSFGAVAVCLIVLLGGLAGWATGRLWSDSADIGQVLFLGGLAIALVGLILVEQLYRNSPVEGRHGLQALVLGLGGIFAYDLFLYSQAVLFNGIDSIIWAARGAVNVLFVPAIAIAARRNPDWKLRVFVSRHVVFYTTTLVSVGVYLLLMSAGGYLLVRFGGSWGALARIVFFAGAIVVLLVLLFSSTMRARLRVFLSKHFFQNKYDYRDEWMRLIETLADFEWNSSRDVAVRAIAQIVGSTSGVLWVYSKREGKFLSYAYYEYAQTVPDLHPEDALLAFISRDNWIVDLDEFERDPGLYTGLELPKWTRELDDPWLFVPLMFGDELLGLVMLDRAPGRARLNYEDRDLLKTAGNHVAVHLAQARSDRLLAEAQQFEAYNKLTAFLMHDLNNLIAQQSLIVSNAEKHKRNPEFVDDAISTIAGSVDRLERIMAQLKRGRGRKTSKPVELRFLVSTAVDRCGDRAPRPTLVLNGHDAVVNTNTDEFVMVLTHLIRNAQDATPQSGSVTVEIECDNESAQVIIRDSGSGMSPEFVRERLFRPFESTKGSEGMGIGAYQAREFAQSHGGELRVSSVVGQGTQFILSLPKVRR